MELRLARLRLGSLGSLCADVVVRVARRARETCCDNFMVGRSFNGGRSRWRTNEGRLRWEGLRLREMVHMSVLNQAKRLL